MCIYAVENRYMVGRSKERQSPSPFAFYQKTGKGGMKMDVDVHFSALYEDNVSFLLMLCRKRVGYRKEYQEIIEDCIQDTFIIAMAKWDTLKDHPNIRAWLVRTCLNLLLPGTRI